MPSQFAIDPAITLACLARSEPRLQADDMVATIKIIPLAVAGRIAQTGKIRHRRAGHGAGDAVPAGARRIDFATNCRRLRQSGDGQNPGPARANGSAIQRVPSLVEEARVAHTIRCGCRRDCPNGRGTRDLIVVFGASAVTDSEDVIPAAILEAQAAHVERVGHAGRSR
jgi:molybdenum cofactor cytidylyltransferase